MPKHNCTNGGVYDSAFYGRRAKIVGKQIQRNIDLLAIVCPHSSNSKCSCNCNELALNQLRRERVITEDQQYYMRFGRTINDHCTGFSDDEVEDDGNN